MPDVKGARMSLFYYPLWLTKTAERIVSLAAKAFKSSAAFFFIAWNYGYLHRASFAPNLDFKHDHEEEE